MRFLVLSIGQKSPAWVTAGVRDYTSRLPDKMLELLELPLAVRTKSSDPRRAQAEENQRLIKSIPAGSHVVALHPKGRSMSTEMLADRMREWKLQGRDLTFLIGGPEGLTDSSLQRSDEQWSLSQMTFPHMLVRVILAEQLYRAWTILQNHPYHR